MQLAASDEQKIVVESECFAPHYDWHGGAAFGARLGMEIAGATGHCRIIRVHGMICDTNPTVVAMAAIRAVWKAVGYEPPARLEQAIEENILNSYQLSLADLESLLRATTISEFRE